MATASGAYQRCTNGGRQSRSASKAGTSAGRGGGCAPGSGALPHRAQARAAALVLDVQTERLLLERRRGALISQDRAVLKTFAFAQLLRDAWLGWQAHIGPELAAQFGVDAGGSSLTGASRSSYPTRGADGPSIAAPEVAMPYAEGRTYYDADSHLMELADWLVQYADPGIRDRIRPLYLGAAGALAERAVSEAVARRGDPTAARDLEGRLMDAKGWAALGAFDPPERSRALDLLGVAKQLVFSTFAATQFIGDDDDVLFGGTRAHNRAMAAFCAHDRRLIAVGAVPWGDPDRTVAEAREAIRLGCGALLVPSAPARERSPFHPDYFPLWALLEETGVPFMLHVGGGGRPLRRAFHANGLPPVTDFLGGGENIRSKDFMVLHVPPETFLSCMALDGVFERFPRLRGGCIEQGAMWIVPWLRRLDIAQATFRRTEPTLALPLHASDYIRRQMKFTPFATEPVGWIIEQVGAELLLFSTDYPHPEGTRDPLGRFEASMAGLDEEAKARFYAGNFAEMMAL